MTELAPEKFPTCGSPDRDERYCVIDRKPHRHNLRSIVYNHDPVRCDNEEFHAGHGVLPAEPQPATKKPWKLGECPNCGHSTKKGGHFVPPSFGDPGMFACEGVCDECKAAAKAVESFPVVQLTPDYKALTELAARVLLQHLNDEAYEMSLAGLYAKLTEHL